MSQFVTILGFSVFFASIPTGLFLAILRWVGLESRERPWRLALGVLWGAAGGVALGLLWAMALGRPLESVVRLAADRARFEAVFTVPLAEELAKGVLFVILLRTGRLTTALSGLLYGIAAGLGFAMTENFAYFLDVYEHDGGGAWFVSVVVRTFFSGSLHAAASGLFGAAVGLSLTDPGRRVRRLAPYAGLIGAFALHAGWNLLQIVSSVSGDPGPAGAGLLAVPFIGAVIVVLAVGCLENERRVIQSELEHEEATGRLPENHARILSRPGPRGRGGWLKDWVNREEYVATALDLVRARRHALRRGYDPDSTDSAASVDSAESSDSAKLLALRRRLSTLLSEARSASQG